MKRVVRFFTRLVIIVLLLVSILFITSKLLEDKIVDKAINIINAQLDVPVYVNSVSFSLIKKFPNATLQLNEVAILSAKEFNSLQFADNNADTLVYIKKLFLSIDLTELIDNKLNITKAYVQDGYLNILIDKNGRENYRITSSVKKVVKSDSSNTNFSFLLDRVQLKQFEIRFINKYKNSSVSIFAPDYTVNGEFYKKNYTANTRGELLLNYFQQGNIIVKPDLPANIHTDLTISNNQIHITNGHLKTKDYQFTTSGYINFGTKINLDIKVNGSSSNINKLISIFYSDGDNSLISNGQIGVSAIIKGNLGSTTSPQVIANFKLQNGSVSYKNGNHIIDSLQFDGSFTNGRYKKMSSSSIVLNNVHVAKGVSSVKADIKIVNFLNPKITANGNVAINIAEIESMMKSSSQFQMGGYIDGSFSIEGAFDTKSSISQVAKWSKMVNLSITNGMFKMNDDYLNIDNINGKVNLDNNKLSLNNFNGLIQDNKIKGDISIRNIIMPLIDSTYPIIISANIVTDIIAYKDFKHMFEGDKSDGSSRQVIINGSIFSNKLLFNKLVASDVKGHIYYGNNNLQITDLSFNAMGGSVTCDINYKQKRNNKYMFQTYTSTKNVNISTLFSTFDNFGQNFIVSQNIGGSLSTDFDLEMDFVNGKLKTSSIDFLGHSRIDNGKLIDFKPIKDASKFSNNEEMRNIEFTTLQTNILISDSKINIPKVTIESNAFDITLNGFHKFNGDYEYHMRINLLDFIGSKSKRLAKQQTEFGYIEDDGYGATTLYLLATSNNGKSKVKLDGNEVKKSMKKNVKKEKHELKKALHDQFGWFKNDTTLNSKKKEKKSEFVIEWDEE